MRYMIIVKHDEPLPPPSSEMLAEMGKFNEELIAAGKMLAGEGLQPSKSGARVEKRNGELVITDGPFAEAKEVIGGFWIIEAADKAEALEWVKRIPWDGDRGSIEVRRVSEMSDFVHDEVSGEWLDKEEAFRKDGQWPTGA